MNLLCKELAEVAWCCVLTDEEDFQLITPTIAYYMTKFACYLSGMIWVMLAIASWEPALCKPIGANPCSIIDE